MITEESSDDKDIYTEEGIQNFMDDDELSVMEQGFMVGYLEN